ncbi:cytochrome P450 [Streptomyces sp. NPDC004658]|uniref:cytochrome P450 n=1 Tax=Streptomyces sp. NPDC004658 TaxID=3154672 RepID=UPI0033A7A028
MSSASYVPLPLRREGLALPSRLAQIRAAQPLVKVTVPSGSTLWLVTRYEDIRQVLADHRRFRSDGRGIPDPHNDQAYTEAAGDEPTRHGHLTHYDPPDHRRLRSMISHVFSGSGVARLLPKVEALATEAVNALIAAGPGADLVETFCFPIPCQIICELLGVPYEDRAQFQRRAQIRFDGRRSRAARGRALEQSLEYMGQLVRANRADPGDGLIGSLIRRHGSELDDTELAGLGDLLLLGGFETTAHMLSLGSLLLMRDPEAAAMIQDPGQAPQIIEELLRYTSVVQTGVPRVAQEDCTLAGVRIRRGERLACLLPSGNRDERFTDPDTFRPDREVNPHLAFGHGIHYCVGAPLARAEMLTALPLLFRRLSGIAPAVPDDELTWRPYAAVYGLDALPVTW